MSTAKWENLLLPRLAGAPQAMVQAELVRVIDDFCVRSCVWRERFSEQDITAGQQTFTLTAVTTNAVTVGVLDAYINDLPLRQRALVFTGATTNRPLAFTVRPERPAVMLFDAEPEETLTGVLDVDAYLAPVDVTEALPSLLTDMFFEVIFDGVLAAMYASPDKPYTDTKLAVFHGTRYLSGLNRARVAAKMGHTSHAQNWAFPRFGR